MLIPTTTCLPQSDSRQPNEWAKQTGYWKKQLLVCGSVTLWMYVRIIFCIWNHKRTQVYRDKVTLCSASYQITVTKKEMSNLVYKGFLILDNFLLASVQKRIIGCSMFMSSKLLSLSFSDSLWNKIGYKQISQTWLSVLPRLRGTAG